MQTSQTGHIHPEFAARRRFNSALSGVLVALFIASACGGGNPTSPTIPPPPSPTPPAGNVAGSVSANHERPHVAIITAAQLAAAAPLLIDISNGLHSHTVALTGAQVGQIAAGTRVSVTSSMDPHSNGTDPHNHIVTFN